MALTGVSCYEIFKQQCHFMQQIIYDYASGFSRSLHFHKLLLGRLRVGQASSDRPLKMFRAKLLRSIKA